MTNKVKLMWVSHIKDKDEKEAFRSRLIAQQDIWERLEQIVMQKLEANSEDIKDYDCPSWAYRQAHVNGYREAYLEMLDLLPLTEG